MADSNSEPPRCPCGFWGSSQTQGLCSKCYREHQKKTSEADSSAPTPQSAVSFTADTLSQAIASVKPVAMESEPSQQEDNSQQDSGASSAGVAASEDTSCADAEMVTEPSTPAPQPSADSIDTADTTTSSQASNGSNSSKTDSNGKDPQPGSKRERNDTEEELDPDRPVQKNKKRCFKCNTRLELAIREIGRCRCDYVFCQLHRLPEQHDCIYNHKEKGRQEAREKMVSPKKHVGTTLKRLDSDS